VRRCLPQGFIFESYRERGRGFKLRIQNIYTFQDPKRGRVRDEREASRHWIDNFGGPIERQ